MSDIIEEKLNNIYNLGRIEVNLLKERKRQYEIKIQIDWKIGFTFNYLWNESSTIDKNVENIVGTIDYYIVEYYKK